MDEGRVEPESQREAFEQGKLKRQILLEGLHRSPEASQKVDLIVLLLRANDDSELVHKAIQVVREAFQDAQGVSDFVIGELVRRTNQG